MILLVTDSNDFTADYFLSNLVDLSVFRCNIDRFQSLKIHWDPFLDVFSISDGPNLIFSNQITFFYFRKPFTVDLKDSFVTSELKYLVNELFAFVKRRNIPFLVEPFADRRIGKLSSLYIAKDLFLTPKSLFSLGFKLLENDDIVVKSLSSAIMDNGNVLYSTVVNPNNLDLSYPWFQQELVHSEFDLTVVYVNGNCFGFKLKRDFKGIDWREHIYSIDLLWEVYEIDAFFARNIKTFMDVCDLKFGRLDFLINDHNIPVFLEVNPNGQWAWLDFDNRILNSIYAFIKTSSN
jgi:hypothetical protein